MDKNCSITRDLYPLYAEGMLREESASFVREHLEHCADCRQELEPPTPPEKEVYLPCDRETLPLKTVKKKLRRRILWAMGLAAAVTLLLVLIIPAMQSHTTDFGVSELYTLEEQNQAAEIILETFNQWEGCKLYSIYYTSDEYCLRELDYCNTLAPEGTVYTQCIVFRTRFRSPIFGGGAWNSNQEYDWGWYLARVPGGSWELLTWGAP